MTRMTEKLSLVLIGSALILAGCSAPQPPPPPPPVKEDCKDDPEPNNGQPRRVGCTGTAPHSGTAATHHGRTHHGGRGVFVTPVTPRAAAFHAPAPSAPRPAAPAAPSSRAGGFGSTGHGVGS